MELAAALEEAGAYALDIPRAWRQASPADQLRTMRSSRRMSQRHLAEAAGVDQALICRLERGADARWETWRRLFAALGYEAVLAPLPSSEDVDDLTDDEIEARKSRAEEGRRARWGGRYKPRSGPYVPLLAR